MRNEIALALLLVGVTQVIRWGLQLRARRMSDAIWRATSERLGLRYFEGGWSGGKRLSGTIEGVAVEATEGARDEAAAIAWRLRPERGAIPDLTLHREDVLSRVARLFDEGELEIGDPAFDQAVHVRGAPELTRAVLTAEARAKLLALLEGGKARVDRGELQVRVPGAYLDGEAFAAACVQLVEVAASLRVVHLTEALAGNVRQDPLARVRRLNLEALREADASHPAVEEALEDPDPAVRLLAARSVRSEAALRVTEALLRDPSLSSELRSTALRHFVDTAPRERSDAVLAEALGTTDRPLVIASLEHAVRDANPEWLPSLLALSDAVPDAVAEALASALGKLGEPAAEPRLLQLLARESEAVQQAAIEALSLVGSVSAVEPLWGLTQSALESGKVRAAAKAAVSAIQSRLGAVEVGRVSLHEPDGRVSLSAGRGELSHPEPPERPTPPSTASTREKP